MEVSVAIGTFGTSHWVNLAHQRAMRSVPEGVPIVYRHGDTLAQARNEALRMVETEYVIHLDADDELGEGYIEAMAKGAADLRAPSVQRVRGGKDYGPTQMLNVWGHTHQCVGECLRRGNWMVIGTCARTELLREVGGWEEWGWSEDWALWARAWKAGGTVEPIPEAVYRAFWGNGRSRNRQPNRVTVDWHRKIEAAVWPEEESVL